MFNTVKQAVMRKVDVISLYESAITNVRVHRVYDENKGYDGHYISYKMRGEQKDFVLEKHNWASFCESHDMYTNETLFEVNADGSIDALNSVVVPVPYEWPNELSEQLAAHYCALYEYDNLTLKGVIKNAWELFDRKVLRAMPLTMRSFSFSV